MNEDIELEVLDGDATAPQGDGVKIIMHVCNDIGGWGSGFVLALSEHWTTPESEYRSWSRTGSTHAGVKFSLGGVQFVQVEEDLFIANMIGQKGIRRSGGLPPIRYPALKKCLKRVSEFAVAHGASVHCPFKMGADRAGGDWDRIVGEVNELICSKGIPVTAYKLSR
jgi:O-acetyl-ADP-ribose deacetylase (regulator of RNase III)